MGVPKKQDNASENLIVLSDGLTRAVARNKYLHSLRQTGQIEELRITDMENRIDNYFDFCISNSDLPTPAGLCVELGLNHKGLLRLLKEDSEQSEVMQNAMEVIHTLYQQAVVKGDLPVKVYTFMAKNYWNMSDKEIIEVKTENNDVRIVEIDSRLNTLRQLNVGG